MKSLFTWLLAFMPVLALAQGTWDIKDPGTQAAVKCGDCLSKLASKPKEVQFGLFTDDLRNVWFVCTSEAFFDQLITKGGDGVAVDVVSKTRYACGGGSPEQGEYFRGTILKPTYQGELKKGRQRSDDGSMAVKVGVLTAVQAASTYELNLILLKDRNLCYYNTFYDLARYKWDLLNMGMYMDSLTYGGTADTASNARSRSILRRKAMHFTIPFEKNKSEYSSKDLQPMYDSLRLTEFNIKRIDIEAYSSVEGPEARNIELQQKRAQSIVDALQSFQTPNITTTVKASENWVEFLNDVLLTGQAELAQLPKSEIKERLKDKRVSDALEPMLAYHRKAVITLELTRKDGFEGMSEQQLISTFEQAIANKNMKRAMEVQNSVMARITDESLPSSFLERLEVPAQRDFVDLLNSRVAFKHFNDPSDAFQTYLALEELDRLLPRDKHVRYNMCAVKFRLWLLGGQTVDPVAFEKEITALRGMGIEEPLVKRMLVNHNIVMAEVNMAGGAWAKKDACIKYIERNYKSLQLSDQDHLSLAQYFAAFANFEEAINVVKPLVSRIDVSEDILFYYLNLTIVDPAITKKADYRKVMLNAINKNKPRFCGLFDAFGKGGITFQLLEDEYLKKTYCETCQ